MSSITRETLLITVKTYPTFSTKYQELVCTAGVRKDGSWIRMYPIPFRRLKNEFQFKKYNWIEIDLQKRTHNEADKRPESYCPVNYDTIKPVGTVGTESGWEERKNIILKKCRVFENLNDMIDGAKNNTMSLGVFKPSYIHELKIERTNLTEEKRKENIEYQQNLFPECDVFRDYFKLAKQLPFKFSYVFEDSTGKTSTLMINDWEIGELFWNCLKQADNEQDACEKVRKKYFDTFISQKDIYFFLGTTLQYHMVGKNPYIIIGLFYPPKIDQLSFDFVM